MFYYAVTRVFTNGTVADCGDYVSLATARALAARLSRRRDTNRVLITTVNERHLATYRKGTPDG